MENEIKRLEKNESVHDSSNAGNHAGNRIECMHSFGR